MGERHVPIGQVKRDISDLVNQVAYQGQRVILTSRGKPKAALVSMQDYERLRDDDGRLEAWQEWLAEADALAGEILARRGGQPLDLDAILRQDRDDLEARDDRLIGSN